MKNISLPKGFKAAGIHCGIKSAKKDLAMIYSQKKCAFKALFTKNKVKAAPVLIDEKLLKKGGYLKALIVNSGNANCMTGKKGLKDAALMCAETAKALNIKKDEVFVSSTGIIGKILDINPVKKGIKQLSEKLSSKGLITAAEAIMTTDKFKKISSRTFALGGKKITVTGFAKGAGMINPDMATMLCFILTDADIDKGAMGNALKLSAKYSFNSITIDGDMSTNDTVLLMANGLAGNKTIKTGSGSFNIFLKTLKDITLDLAKMMVRDGEGASKFITIDIKGAKTERDAIKASQSLSNSLLLKCAVHGGDPNWGRVASSIGASGASVDPGIMDIELDKVYFVRKGKSVNVSSASRKKVFKRKDVSIVVNLNAGDKESTAYTCDITKEYIRFNSHYTT